MKFIIIVAIITGVYVVGMDIAKKYTNSIDFSQVAKTPKKITVQIVGEVNTPGVYDVEEGTTLAELIAAAGGLTENADSSSIKYSRVLQANTRYTIGKITKEEPKLVSINQGSVTDLATVPGIGVTLASRIVAYRLENGYFASVEELMKVKGIKDALLEKIRPYLTI